MSCNICLLPFTPGPTATNPRPPPEGILTPAQYNYFMHATGIGLKPGGAILDYVYVDQNMFIVPPNKLAVPVLLTMVWEVQDRTEVMCHTVCMALLRRVLGLSGDTLEDRTDLVEFVKVINYGMAGDLAGRFASVQYEAVCDSTPKLDMRRYWTPGEKAGMNTFEWRAFVAHGHGWMLNRPDIFPRFKTVSQKRLQSVSEPQHPISDRLTAEPDKVLPLIFPYLSNESYVALISTCQYLRKLAMTTFQSEARRRVRALGWAIPSAVEYASAGDNQKFMARDEDEGVADGDWLLYLSHVHRSGGMRVRRHIWRTCVEVRRVFQEKRRTSKYADVRKSSGEVAKSKARVELEGEVKRMEEMAQMMHKGVMPKQRFGRMG